MRVKEAKSHKSVPIVIITYCKNLKRIVEVILITDLRPKRCTSDLRQCPVSSLVVSFDQPQKSEFTFECYVLCGLNIVTLHV